MPVIRGYRNTDNIQQTQHRQIIDQAIKLLDGDVAVFIRFLKSLKTTDIAQRYRKWGVDQLPPQFITATVDKLANATSLTFSADDAASIEVNALLRVVGTGEIVRVSANPVNGTLTVTRGFAGTTAADIDNGDLLQNLGNAYAESTQLETPVTMDGTYLTNWTQIWRDNVEFSRTSEDIQAKGGYEHDGDPAHQRKKKLIEHMAKINRSALYGVASSSGSLRTAGGLDSYITAPRRVVTGTLTEGDLLDMLEVGMEYGDGGKKTLIMGNYVARSLNEMIQSRVRYDADAKQFGVNVMSYTSAYGDVDFIRDNKVLTGPLSGEAFLVDNAEAEWCPLHDTELLKDREENDRDGLREEYLTEGTFYWGETRKHAKLSGVLPS